MMTQHYPFNGPLENLSDWAYKIFRNYHPFGYGTYLEVQHAWWDDNKRQIMVKAIIAHADHCD